MPPTRSWGRIATAVTMMPTPPIQCRIERHRRRPRGKFSRPEKTVAPVVVMPETLSKTESVTEYPEIRKGRAPTRLMTTQMLTVSRKASRWPICIVPPRAITQNRLPTRVEMVAEAGKTKAIPSPSAMSISAHGIIAAVTSSIMIPSA